MMALDADKPKALVSKPEAKTEPKAQIEAAPKAGSMSDANDDLKSLPLGR
jgi:hypothetical protein